MTDHLERFLEFSRREIATGGPDPHMKLATNIDPSAWFCGLYTIPYVVSSAEVIRHYLPEPRTIDATQAEWLWKRIVVRKERKVNGFGPKKLEQTINGLNAFVHDYLPIAQTCPDFNSAFEYVVDSMPNYGRYFGMKFYESLRRAGHLQHEFTDIRPKGGAMSRTGLALLYPQHDYKLNKPFALEETNALANELRHQVPCDWFTIEVLLCNYRQACNGQQYPGRGHDSELGHFHKVQALNPTVNFRTLEARRVLFPHEYLGELNGWDGRRDLGKEWKV